MDNITKGSWVQVSTVVLKAGERAPQVPADTQEKDYTLWVKGFLQHDAKLGDEVTVETITARVATGRLCAVNPPYEHSFGEVQEELLHVAKQLKELMQ